jgi:hypothetical protein
MQTELQIDNYTHKNMDPKFIKQHLRDARKKWKAAKADTPNLHAQFLQEQMTMHIA